MDKCSIPKFKYKNIPEETLLKMNYQSPIEAIRHEMEMRFENDVMKAVQQHDIFVDKDELIKALRYDRDQYTKGFQDGCQDKTDKLIEQVRADTVRKMHSEIEARCIKGGIYPAFVKSTIDQIVNEILGENK